MVRAFEFFGCVPKEVWWDNPKTVATLILLGRQRHVHPRYAALASHSVFNPLVCMPARGNEKPDAENTVRAVQRRFSTPVPHVQDLDELNRSFPQRWAAERERTVQSLFGPFLIGTRFDEERAAAAPLPRHRFDPCVIRQAAPVDKYPTAAFARNRYSVPRQFALQMVMVKGYVDRVVIVAGGQVVATHVRSLLRDTLVLDPLHYRATLARQPGALDHAPVFRDGKLPGCFAGLRAELEEHHGSLAGARRFVPVLQLLADHPMSRVREAVEAGLRETLISAAAVIQRTRTLAACELLTHRSPAWTEELTPRPQVHVPLPDLSRFNHRLCDLGSPEDAGDPERACAAAAAACPGRVTVDFT